MAKVPPRKGEKTALVPRRGRVKALERRTRKEDQELVDRVVTRLRKIGRRAQLGAAVEAGGVLVDAFFDGDIERARSHDPTKPTALNLLFECAAETELPVRLLRRAIPIAAQYQGLPASLRDELTVGQHTALLLLDDPREKARLAVRAADEHLTEKQIEAIVRGRPDRPPRGRPPKMALERAVPAARRVLMSAIIESELTVAKLRQLDPAARGELAGDLRLIRERAELIADALQRVR